MLADNFLPNVFFLVQEKNGKFIEYTTHDLFENKKILLVGVVAAFSPYCQKQLDKFEEYYDAIIKLGFDDIYCISVNDTIVMNQWAKKSKVKKVKMIPDGGGTFTKFMGMLVKKDNICFGDRSWRYVAIVDDRKIEHIIEEPYKRDNCAEDPFVLTVPDKILKYLMFGDEPTFINGSEPGANDITPPTEPIVIEGTD